MFTRVQRDAIAAARHSEGLSVAEIANAARDGRLGGLAAFHVSARSVNRICREAEDARELERQDRELTAKVESICRRVVAEYMAACEGPKAEAPNTAPVEGAGGLLDQLLAAELERAPEVDRGGRNFTPDDELARAIAAPAPPDGDPPERDPEADRAERIAAGIQEAAAEAKQKADREYRAAMEEISAKLGDKAKSEPGEPSRLSGVVNAVTGQRYLSRR